MTEDERKRVNALQEFASLVGYAEAEIKWLCGEVNRLDRELAEAKAKLAKPCHLCGG